VAKTTRDVGGVRTAPPTACGPPFAKAADGRGGDTGTTDATCHTLTTEHLDELAHHARVDTHGTTTT